MYIDLLTKEDLAVFKAEILEEFRALLKVGERENESEWLRSKQVRKLLAISPGTLQNLRVQGILAFTKVGGSFFTGGTRSRKCFRTNKLRSKNHLELNSFKAFGDA